MVRKYQLKSRTQAKLGFSAKRVHLKTTGTADGAANMFARKVRDIRSSTFATTTAVILVERRTR